MTTNAWPLTRREEEVCRAQTTDEQRCQRLGGQVRTGQPFPARALAARKKMEAHYDTLEQNRQLEAISCALFS
jgi:hypothetical protein